MKLRNKNYVRSKSTLKFYVENVNLTVNYYKEYAGFRLIERSQKLNFMHSAKMNFHDNIILFERTENENLVPNKKINFQLYLNKSQLKELYDNYKQKIKINHVSFIDGNQINEFSIKDCDGNIISFQNH
jgi:hypothetical protein